MRSKLHSCDYASPVEYCTDMLKWLWRDLEKAWLQFVNWLPW